MAISKRQQYWLSLSRDLALITLVSASIGYLTLPLIAAQPSLGLYSGGSIFIFVATIGGGMTGGYFTSTIFSWIKNGVDTTALDANVTWLERILFLALKSATLLFAIGLASIFWEFGFPYVFSAIALSLAVSAIPAALVGISMAVNWAFNAAVSGFSKAVRWIKGEKAADNTVTPSTATQPNIPLSRTASTLVIPKKLQERFDALDATTPAPVKGHRRQHSI